MDDKYDIVATEAHKKSSIFHIHGYTEEFFNDGRLIGRIRHDAIPVGRELGSDGEICTTLKEKTVFSHPTQGNVMRFPNCVIVSRVDPICGRMKKSIHDLL